ncbi:MAG: hypothetical protein PHO23_02695 [Candidatus Pacebacteria bacterium]|nr:hypothetical protein [Candidatus Paceibacterota bacterium]
MQDANTIEREKSYDKFSKVELFVIDESHNLKNENSKRYAEIIN